MMITAPGIYKEFPTQAYFDDPCPAPSFTQSLAKVLIAQSAGHAMVEHPRLAPPLEEDEPAEKYNAAMAIGNAAHSLMIGRGKTLAVADFPNWTTKDAKAFKADAIERDIEPILAKHHARAVRLVAVARQQMDDAGWKAEFRDGQAEVVLAWQEDGFWFRTMLDWMVSTTRLCDLKTTAMSVAPHSIGKLMVDAGWDVQAAMHERGLNALDPENAGRRRFRFWAQENYLPFAGVPVELSEAWLTMGRKKLDAAIDIWKLCMGTNTWPLYPAAAITPEYPGWQQAQWLAREETEFAGRPREPMLTDIMGG